MHFFRVVGSNPIATPQLTNPRAEWGERLGFISKVSDIFVINSREGCDQACPYLGDKLNPCRKEQATLCGCTNPTMGRTIGESFGICGHCAHIIIRHGSDLFHYYRSYCCGFPYYGKACCAPSK